MLTLPSLLAVLRYIYRSLKAIIVIRYMEAPVGYVALCLVQTVAIV